MFNTLPPDAYDAFWKTELLNGGKLGLFAGVATSLVSVGISLASSTPINKKELALNSLFSTVAGLTFAYFKIFFPQLALATTVLTVSISVINIIKNKQYSLPLSTAAVVSMLCFVFIQTMPMIDPFLPYPG